MNIDACRELAKSRDQERHDLLGWTDGSVGGGQPTE